MSLATRCSSCGTIFRVVQDQLKVSEGWVRCGRCQEVFNALQNLFDLDREAPPPWPPAPPPPAPEPAWDRTQTVAPVPPESSSEDDAPSTDPAHLSTQPLLHTASRDLLDDEASDPEDTGFEDARFNEDLIDEEEEFEVFGASQLEPMPAPPPPEVVVAAKEAPPKPMPKAGKPRASEEDAPGFVKQAERAARWQHPAVRAGLMVLLLLSGLSLAAQIGVHWRDELVAHWPESQQVIGPLCAAVDCRIEPPRRLESLAVDASGLTQLDVPGQYKLSVVLRNHGNAPVMLPHFELSLTDAQGQLVSRRALAPTELGARQNSLPSGGELPLQAAFAVGDQRVVGYTVEIFYP